MASIKLFRNVDRNETGMFGFMNTLLKWGFLAQEYERKLAFKRYAVFKVPHVF